MEWFMLLPVLPLAFIVWAAWPSRHGDTRPGVSDFDRRALKVRRYYEKHPGLHDAAYAAGRFGFSVGTIHDIRAGRQGPERGPVKGW
jgi:hypothetical protein